MSPRGVKDGSLADEGFRLISWAEQFMPALGDAFEAVDRSNQLRGRRVGIVSTLEPKKAVLAIAFDRLGAHVSVYWSGSHTDPRVVAALESLGLGVDARADGNEAENRTMMEQFVDRQPEFLIDDGATVARHIHTKRQDALSSLRGIASGVRPLRVMEQEGVLQVPCIAVNDARVNHLSDSVYGTGQSVVMTVLDTTNTQLQGKSCVVIGYGRVGRGIAKVAHGLGARVSITEVDPVRALQAVHDGYRVQRLEEACADGDIFITATGVGHSLTADHLSLMKDGALVAVGGAGTAEVSLDGKRRLVRGAMARPDVRTIPTDDGKVVFLVADGERCNVSAAEGNPIEIVDLSLAVQLRAVDHLARNEGTLTPSVHGVPPDIDDAVANSLLRARGVDLDEPPEARRRHADTGITRSSGPG